MRLLLRNLLLSLLWMPLVWAAPDQTMSIVPAASSGATITASDENTRNSNISTPYNLHTHTDISSTSANTFNIGDGAAGNKNLCANAADGTDSCIRWNDTANLWTIDHPTAGTFNQIAVITGTVGVTGILYGDGTGAILGSGSLTSGGVLFGGGGGAPTASAVMTNGQLLIGDGSGAPTVASLTAGTNITITPGAGSITIAAAGATVVSDRVHRTAGDVTTTSTTLVDFTGASITLTTGANPALVGFNGSCSHDTGNADIRYNVDIDGSLVLGTTGIVKNTAVASQPDICSFVGFTADLTAASHTFKLQWSTSTGTATTTCDGGVPCQFWVQEVTD